MFHSTPIRTESPASGSARVLLDALSQDRAVRFGDEITLTCRSVYLKHDKPSWYGGSADWKPSELKPQPLGTYTKKAGTVVRVAIPPIGDLAPGSFRPNHFRVEDAVHGRRSDGKVVRYGVDSLMLVDDKGLVWSNKRCAFLSTWFPTPFDRRTHTHTTQR